MSKDTSLEVGCLISGAIGKSCISGSTSGFPSSRKNVLDFNLNKSV